MFLCPSISCLPNKAVLPDNHPMGCKPSKLATRDDDDDDDDPMLLEALRPECLKANNSGKVAKKKKKKKKRQLHSLEREDVKISISNGPAENDTAERSVLTLGDWLLSTSPGSKPDNFREGELCILKNISARAPKPTPTPSPSRSTHKNYRSSPAATHNHRKGSDDDHDHRSFSLERLVMLDRARDLEEYYSIGVSSSSTKRGRSGKKEIKTVRFRSPQGLTNVFVYSSPAAE